MQLKNLFPLRRITWPALLSVGLHGGVIAALLLISIQDTNTFPDSDDAPLAVTMVNPANFVAAPQPATVEPERQPELIEKTQSVPEIIPKSIPLPKPEPAKKEVVKPKPVPKEFKKTESKPIRPVINNSSLKSEEPMALSQNSPMKAAPIAPISGAATTAGPKVLSKSKPIYPARALALGIEGHIKVQYDINEDGRVTNVRVLEATPRNVFEREVKQAMRKWRYEAIAAKDYVTVIVFKMGGQMEMN